MIILDLALALIGAAVVVYSIWGLFNGSALVSLLPLAIGIIFIYKAYNSYNKKRRSREEYYSNLKCPSCNSFGNMDKLFKDDWGLLSRSQSLLIAQYIFVS